jgi:RNA polymerase sigma-70 factor (ECF subfamily)
MDERLQVVHESSVEEPIVVVEPLSFEVFFDREARTLFRRLCAVTGNPAEAEEIMQDTFLALLERWERVGRMDDPTGYLYRTAMNQFRKRTRRAALALRRTIVLAPDSTPFSQIDEQQDVVAALRELTPRQRAALVLTEVLGYTSEEAGAALGISAGTVRGLASRGRSALRLQMGEPDE